MGRRRAAVAAEPAKEWAFEVLEMTGAVPYGATRSKLPPMDVE